MFGVGRSDGHVHRGDSLPARLKDWLVANDELALRRSAVTGKQPADLHRVCQPCLGPHALDRLASRFR